ncbi:MAG: Rha family transcriptional regulator [Hungatella sp.]|jgi:phage regulator Rha-like protein|nr:Rha family transcriptional regulator [Hungatella sp.]
MNDLRKTTITTLEVAEMMETEHWKLLRKLDGDKKSSGIIKILTDNNFVVSDYFIPSTYRDASGKENKCYEVTYLGCDFLANKSIGEKGVLFTARYVKRFYEMKNSSHYIPATPTEHPGEVANLLKIISRVMEKQGSVPYEVAENARMICEQYGIILSPKFVKIPDYEQMSLFDAKGGS